MSSEVIRVYQREYDLSFCLLNELLSDNYQRCRFENPRCEECGPHIWSVCFVYQWLRLYVLYVFRGVNEV
jgi:hypothetical protein